MCTNKHTNTVSGGHVREMPTCLQHVTFPGCNVAKERVSQDALITLSQVGSVGRKAEQRRLTVIMDELLCAFSANSFASHVE